MLQNERIYLRAPEPGDLEFLYLFENDLALWPISLSLAPFSKEVLRQYLENATADLFTARQLRLMVCLHQDNLVIGTVDLFDFEPQHQRAGVGIAIACSFRDQGYGKETLELLEFYAANVLLLHQLYCSVSLQNSASLQLFRQAGFQEIGLRRDWLRTAIGWQDVVELQKILSFSINA